MVGIVGAVLSMEGGVFSSSRLLSSCCSNEPVYAYLAEKELFKNLTKRCIVIWLFRSEKMGKYEE